MMEMNITASEKFFVLVAEMRHYCKLVEKNLTLDVDEEYINQLLRKRNELVKQVDDVIMKVKNSKSERAASVQSLVALFEQNK